MLDIAHEHTLLGVITLKPLSDLDWKLSDIILSDFRRVKQFDILLCHISRRLVLNAIRFDVSASLTQYGDKANLHNIVKWLPPPLRQSIDLVHPDPLLRHIALVVPAIDDRQIISPQMSEYLADLVLDDFVVARPELRLGLPLVGRAQLAHEVDVGAVVCLAKC